MIINFRPDTGTSHKKMRGRKTRKIVFRSVGSWGNKLGIFVCRGVLINGAQIKDLLCNRIKKHSIRENTYDTLVKKKMRNLLFEILFFNFQFFQFFLF